MKIIYCIHSVYNPGGMERVLLNKVTYLVTRLNWNITVVTTDQGKRPPFYSFPPQVCMIDLGINYSEDNQRNVLWKIIGYLYRRRKHKKKLAELLQKERADIVVSLYPSESSFLPDLTDGSKKVLELHYCKFFRLQYGRKGLLKFIDRIRTWQDEQLVNRFDRFVVLTNEDKGYWGNLSNITVIPNMALFMTDRYSDVSQRRVIAVGRLDYQKGFDRLIKAWILIDQKKRFQEWHLDIFGQGEWQKRLQHMIDEAGLAGQICLNRPTNQIGEEYADSSFLVMSSNYEGLPMVMIEAMTCGLPVVSFDCQCGPKDIIQHGENGFLVKNGDIEGLATAMMKLMGDQMLRKKMSEKAKQVVFSYSEEAVMAQWVELFTSLKNKS